MKFIVDPKLLNQLSDPVVYIFRTDEDTRSFAGMCLKGLFDEFDNSVVATEIVE